MESTDSSVGGGGGGGGGPHQQTPAAQPHLPPGFRFHPTDEELVVHYLKRKAQSAPLPVSIIAEVDLYKFDPWELPAKAVFGEQEWYFFSPRDRKYPNGARPNRAATSGYWKATGTDKPVLTGGNQKVGVKKALVFYGGKPPRGIKTNWIMHEYRLADNKPSNKPPGYDNCNKKGSLRLDDWVLCRIYKKSNAHRPLEGQERDEAMEDMMMMAAGPMSMSMSMSMSSLPGSIHTSMPHHQQQHLSARSSTLNYTSLLDTHDQGMYETGGMSIDPSLSHHHLASGSASLPLKRTLPSLYWDSPSSGKRVSMNDNEDHHNTASEESGERNDHGNNNNTNNNDNNNNMSTIASLLNQQSMLGSGLQPYPLPGVNWYS